MARYQADVGSNLPNLRAKLVFQHEQKRLLRLSCRRQWDSAGTTGGLPRDTISLPDPLETFPATHSLHQLEGKFMDSCQWQDFIKCLKWRCKPKSGRLNLSWTPSNTPSSLAGLQREALHFIRTSRHLKYRCTYVNEVDENLFLSSYSLPCCDLPKPNCFPVKPTVTEMRALCCCSCWNQPVSATNATA